MSQYWRRAKFVRSRNLLRANLLNRGRSLENFLATAKAAAVPARAEVVAEDDVLPGVAVRADPAGQEAAANSN